MLFPGVLADYVLALEAEIQNLKNKLKALEEQLQSTEEPEKTPVATADPHHGAHSSAEAADTTLADQTSIALAVRKLGDRVHLLNLLVTQLKKKVRLAWTLKVVQAFQLKNQSRCGHRCRL